MGQQRNYRVIGVVITLVLIVVSLSLLPLSLALGFTQSHAPEQVVIHDEANVLDTRWLEEEISNVDFYTSGMRVLVMSVGDIPPQSLNDEMLERIRTSYADEGWIDPAHPNVFAPHVLIIAFSPEGRQVGSYFGEDVMIGASGETAVQDAAKPDYRDGRWQQGTLEAVKEAAGRIDRPFFAGFWGWFIGGIAALAGLVGLGGMGRVRAKNKSIINGLKRSYTNITKDFDSTALAAMMLPQDKDHSTQVLARYEQYKQDYYAATSVMQGFSEPKGLHLFNPNVSTDLQRIHDRVVSVDAMDDVIRNAEILYSHGPTWQQVWFNEIGPICEELAALSDMAMDSQRRYPGVNFTEFQRYVADAFGQVDSLGIQLGEKAIDAEQALSELDVIAQTTRMQGARVMEMIMERMPEYQRRVFTGSISVAQQKEQVYKGYWRWGNRSMSYNPASTIRAHEGSVYWNPDAVWAATTRAGNLDVSQSSWGRRYSWGGGPYPRSYYGNRTYYGPVVLVDRGYHSARSTADPSRSNTSSWGGSGGRVGGFSGGSGGSFSGSGSSSSF